MAKEYKGKITLQDNFSEVISKAIKQTQQLQKEFKKIEKLKANPKVSVDIDENAMAIAKKDLAKLSKNKVKVKTTLDSSFNSTMNTINKATAQNKTIKITAEENVTRTVKNLQRDIFTVERKLKTSLLGGGRYSGGLSGNITTSSPDLVSTLNQGFNKLIKTNLTKPGKTNVSNYESGSIIRDLATNGLGTSAAMAAAGLTGANLRKPIKANNVDVDGGKINLDGALNNLGSFKNIIKAGFAEGLKKAKDRAAGVYRADDDFTDIGKGWYKRAYNGNSEFAKLIGQQRVQMASARKNAGLGKKSYLNKYRTENLGGTRVMIQDFSRLESIANNVFDKLGTKIARCNSAMKKLFKIPMKITGLNAISKTLSNLGAKAKVVGLAIRHPLERAFIKASTSVGLFAGKTSASFNKVSNTAKMLFSVISGKANLIPGIFGKWTGPLNLVLKTVGKVGSAIGKIASKAARVTFNIVGNALKTSAQILSNVTKAIAAAAGGLVFKGVMDGALNEQYEVSMLHFIQNAGGTVDDRDKYMNNAIKLANKTPFSTNEVLEAANRGIGVAGGNTKQASSLLKLAADMAALTPGKTVMDAMEALADLKLGERERMKEFGFKIDNDEFVKAAGLSSGNIADLTPEQMEKAFATLTDGKTGAVGKYFEGGAAKIADTFKGQISTFTGQFGSAFADLGRIITEPLIEPLKYVNSKLEKFANTMKDLKDGVLGGSIPNPFTEWQDFLNWAGKGVNMHNPIANFALTIAPAVSTVISLIDMLKNSFESVFGRIKASLEQAYKPFDDLFGSIEQRAPWVQGIFDVLGSVVATVMEVLGSAFANAYEIVKPILEWIGEHSEEISNIFTALGQIVQMCCEFISSAFQILWPIVEPILSGILDLLNWIAEGLIKDFPEAAKAVDKFGKDVAEFLQPAIDAFKSVWDWCGKALGKVGEWMQNGYSNVVGNIKDFFGGDDYNKNGRAVGQSYVPYNGYKASLHRGEAILTRQEADAWRAGRTNGGNNNNTTQNITINVNGAADANVVAKKVAMELQKVAMNM